MYKGQDYRIRGDFAVHNRTSKELLDTQDDLPNDNRNIALNSFLQ